MFSPRPSLFLICPLLFSFFHLFAVPRATAKRSTWTPTANEHLVQWDISVHCTTWNSTVGPNIHLKTKLSALLNMLYLHMVSFCFIAHFYMQNHYVGLRSVTEWNNQLAIQLPQYQVSFRQTASVPSIIFPLVHLTDFLLAILNVSSVFRIPKV